MMYTCFTDSWSITKTLSSAWQDVGIGTSFFICSDCYRIDFICYMQLQNVIIRLKVLWAKRHIVLQENNIYFHFVKDWAYIYICLGGFIGWFRLTLDVSMLIKYLSSLIPRRMVMDFLISHAWLMVIGLTFLCREFFKLAKSVFDYLEN